MPILYALEHASVRFELRASVREYAVNRKLRTIPRGLSHHGMRRIVWKGVYGYSSRDGGEYPEEGRVVRGGRIGVPSGRPTPLVRTSVITEKSSRAMQVREPYRDLAHIIHEASATIAILLARGLGQEANTSGRKHDSFFKSLASCPSFGLLARFHGKL